MKLEDCRREIDSIDHSILMLLNRRAEIAQSVGLLKAKAGLPVVDSDREAEILRRVVRDGEGVLEDESIVKIFRRIILESRRLQIKTVGGILEKGTEIHR